METTKTTVKASTIISMSAKTKEKIATVAASLKGKDLFADKIELANKIASDFNSAGQVLLTANKKFEDVLKSAKDLGIELPAQIKNQGEALKLYAKDIDYYITKLKGNKIALRNG